MPPPLPPKVQRVGAARTEIEKMVLDVIENETNVREATALEMSKRMTTLAAQVSGKRGCGSPIDVPEGVIHRVRRTLALGQACTNRAFQVVSGASSAVPQSELSQGRSAERDKGTRSVRSPSASAFEMNPIFL